MQKRGRPQTFETEAALASAMDLFWRQGYEGSSLSELLAVMGLSRSSFYQSFGTKDEVFRQCLSRYADGLLGSLRAALAQAPSGRNFLIALLTSVAATAGRAEGERSCLMVNSVTELGPAHPVAGGVLQDGLDAVTALLIQAITRAQSEGAIDPEESPADLAAFFHVSISGLRTMIKAGASPESIRSTVNRLIKAF